MKLVKKQTGATALIEMLAAIALIGVLATQAIPNTFEIREAGLNAVVVSQAMVTRDAIEADFAEASLEDRNTLYAATTAEILPYMPGGTTLYNAFDNDETEPEYDGIDGATVTEASGDVTWTTEYDTTDATLTDVVDDGYSVKGHGDLGSSIVTLNGGGQV